jgi:hypothetical protein
MVVHEYTIFLSEGQHCEQALTEGIKIHADGLPLCTCIAEALPCIASLSPFGKPLDLLGWHLRAGSANGRGRVDSRFPPIAPPLSRTTGQGADSRMHEGFAALCSQQVATLGCYALLATSLHQARHRLPPGVGMTGAKPSLSHTIRFSYAPGNATIWRCCAR